MATLPAEDFRYPDKRKNIPAAGLAAQGKVKEVPKQQFAYDPHLPPKLRFDTTGAADKLPELIAAATQRPLTPDEAQLLADALRNRQPWLEWAGKREKKGFAVDPVALHVHERLAARAILAAAARQDIQRSLFAEPELPYQQAVKFYEHEVDWANRLILGDSLQVMTSLAYREQLAGQVQMIYFDPPYGIKFGSNFQTEVGKREVKDKDSDLTREPEMVRAYRDTWTLGVHSYLAYLRDRLMLAKVLLKDTGSIFVQISDENLHRVRMLLDEVFGAENFVSVITYAKTASATAQLLPNTADYILWYAKKIDQIKFRQIYTKKVVGGEGASKYTSVLMNSGDSRPVKDDELDDISLLPSRAQLFRSASITSQRPPGSFPVEFQGREVTPSGGYWKTSALGMGRLREAGRLIPSGQGIAYLRFFEDFTTFPITNLWLDIGGVQSRADPKIYVVQTATEAIKRCLLMTTDPGDLVLDPTCGSGTTAYVAEHWGRRWITMDSSRVALSLARQRILTAKFDLFALEKPQTGDSDKGVLVNGQFKYKTVSRVTLKSIAQNNALDPIFARHEPILAEKLAALNAALGAVTPDLRDTLQQQLRDKERTAGKRALTDADRRRWTLPPAATGWQPWEVPFDTDPAWPQALQAALTAYRQAWRAKQDEIDAAIQANAEPVPLVDVPDVVKGVVRVSGPFTVEGVFPVEDSGLAADESPIGGAPDDDLETFGQPGVEDAPRNAAAHRDEMLRLLKNDGVLFLNKKQKLFKNKELTPLDGVLHAEGEWYHDDTPADVQRVAVVVGPALGNITQKQVEDAMPRAARNGYDDLLFVGFGFDGMAQQLLDEADHPKLRLHYVTIRPDVAMKGLLKNSPGSQLFTVFGRPRAEIRAVPGGLWQVEMTGVDIYDPVANVVNATKGDKIAAWFLDRDYDGRTFCVTQAFFPDRKAWEKIGNALKGKLNVEALAALSGKISLPFQAGEHGRVAVKVIDPRGNEVMAVLPVPTKM